MLKLYITAQQLMHELKKDQAGATVVEYSVMIGLLLVGILALLGGVADWMNDQWSDLCGGANGLPGCTP